MKTYPPMGQPLPKAPIASRQMVVVLTDEEMERFHDLLDKDRNPEGLFDPLAHGAVAIRQGAGVVAFGLAWRIRQLAKKYAKLSRFGQPVRYIDLDAAEELSFPGPHPVHDVVYAAHPTQPLRYLPVSSFHANVFESMVAEAFRLLWSLGATEIDIEHRVGWESAAGFKASGGGDGSPGATSSAAVNRQGKKDAVVAARFEPHHEPSLPEDTYWYESEPLWQAVAEGRLQAGMTDFRLEVKYDQDFGIDADFAERVTSAGFKLGGEFKKQERTVWVMKGKFAEV